MSEVKDIKETTETKETTELALENLPNKKHEFRDGAKRLLKYLGRYKFQLILVALLTILSTMFVTISPKVLANATDELARGINATVLGMGPGIDFGFIGKMLLICIVIYVGSAIFDSLQNFVISGISAKVSYELRKSISEKMNRLPISYYNRNQHGDLLSRITNDVDTINQSLTQTMTQVVSAVTTLLVVIIMMLSISPIMTGIAFLVLIVSSIVVGVIVSHSQKHFKRQQDLLGAVNSKVEETYGAHLIVKAFNGEKKSVEEFSVENDKLCKAACIADFISGIMKPVMQFVTNLGYVAVCIAGAALVVAGRLTIGGIQAFIQYIGNFMSPIMVLSEMLSQIQIAVASSDRVFDFLEEDEELSDNPKIESKNLEISGNVEFDHVKFAYEDSEDLVIKDFSAKIEPGMKVAIVGPTGAGKTTLVKLLMRFHELTSGKILLDGNDISDFSRGDLRAQFGMVLQDTWLYKGSIKENIRYGNLSATDDEVIKAAKAAQADHFIRTLPGGYDMEINEEADNISAGQKQLLTIARAILANSKILILDEATSSVDTRTEELIQKAMDNLLKGRTSFIIAHRLSTIKNADLILYINEGDIVETGTHDELMHKNGYYAKLYNSQFETIAT